MEREIRKNTHYSRKFEGKCTEELKRMRDREKEKRKK